MAATALFAELTDMIDATPADQLKRKRLSVPQHRKAWLTARAAGKALRD